MKAEPFTEEKTAPRANLASRILAVVVVYNIEADSTPTVRSLKQCILATNDHSTLTLIFDNSDDGINRPPPLDIAVQYIRNPSNLGLAYCYQQAFQIGQDLGITHILFLDQDSVLTHDYWSELIDVTARNLELQADIFLPVIFSNGNRISPLSFGLDTSLINGQIRKTCRTSRISFINSATTMSMQLLAAIQPLDFRLWLDGLDHWMSYKASNLNASVYIMHSKLTHSLSVSSKSFVSDARYENILAAEIILFLTCWSRREQAVYFGRLAYRSVFYVFRFRRLSLSYSSIRQIWRLIGRICSI